MCLAIDFAHEQGIVHDALTPNNIVIGDFGEAYVLGWSHAQALGDSADHRPGALLEQAPAAPAYRAPEHDRGSASKQTDIFALGAVLREIVSGSLAP